MRSRGIAAIAAVSSALPLLDDNRAALLTPAPGDRYLDIRYDSDGTLGLQFHAESDPPFAVARITPGSLTAAQPLALAGMVLVAIAGAEVGPESEYAAVLDMLRRSGRPRGRGGGNPRGDPGLIIRRAHRKNKHNGL